MKILRILILLAMTSMIPTFLMPAVAQQEIDPDHFDQAEIAKTGKSAKRPKPDPESAAPRSRKTSASRPTASARITPRPRQVKAEDQRIAAVHPTAE